ncbi:hypothetical protein Tco_1090430 [Tanacetum coccineum]|uniref:Uncharacterized protein n=1 Tax=Tanacetum coccineum TaxID=301880 RepID=A0ABQ5I6D5_9ASTR
MKNIIRILQFFNLALEIKINISKSHVYGIGVSTIDSENMARDTGCSSGNIPFSYLGLPIGSNMNLLISWNHLIDRFCAKLSAWKANFLSIDSLWVRVIKAIHGDEASFELEGCNSSGICSSIISSYSTLHARDIIPSSSLCRKAGDGMSIRFWKDNWDENVPLCSRYNRLYHLDSNANCLLADRFSNDTWIWNWNRQSIESRVAPLDVRISEIWHISFNNMVLTHGLGKSLMMIPFRSKLRDLTLITACFLRFIPIQDGLTFFLERQMFSFGGSYWIGFQIVLIFLCEGSKFLLLLARRVMLLWNLMIMFSSNVIRILTFGALFARGQTPICLPSLLAQIGCNGLRIGELLKSLKTLCMPFLRLLYGSYGGTAIARYF